MALLGRPSNYTEYYVERVLDGIRRGLSLRALCELGREGEPADGIAPDPKFPCRTAILNWLFDHEDFAHRYARARVQGCEAIADELQDISDDGTNDWMEITKRNGETAIVADHEHISRSKLRVDTRKWYLSKIVPKVFGDHLDVNVQGSVDLVARLAQGRERVRSLPAPKREPDALTVTAMRVDVDDLV